MSDLDADEPNLTEYLTQVPAVVALLGDRVFEGRAPQHVHDTDGSMLPYAVYQRVGGTPGVGFCGTDGLVPGQYQVDVYAADSVLKTQAARAIRRALVDYRGRMGAVTVQQVLAENEFDSQEPEPGLDRRTQTYTIWYVEAEG